jgi:hypothetical protein
MEAAAASRTMLCALPLALLQSVLARLPADARARACVVCRAWNAALAERSLWSRLDLSPASGVAVAVTNAALRAAAARAGKQLLELDLNERSGVGYDAVLAVVTASGAALRELRLWDTPSPSTRSLLAAGTYLLSGSVERLLRAAPQLRVFEVDIGCELIADAARLLSGELLFAPLRVRALTVGHENEAPDEAAVLALAAAVAGHAWLAELTLEHVPLNTAAALDALVDAALARRLRAVVLYHCRLSPASAPALARLVDGGLARLDIVRMQHLHVPAAQLLSNALRASTMLTSLTLCEVGLWLDPAAAVLLLGALTGHQSLRELDFSYNTAGTPVMQVIAGATLGALVAANAPALHILAFACCSLGDAGLGPLVDALPHNTHIHTLVCWHNDISEAFTRARLLPAAQANASLRKLALTDESGEEDDLEDSPGILYELQDLVAARAAAAPQ